MARPMPELAPVTTATFPASKLDIPLESLLVELPWSDNMPIERHLPDLKLAAALFDSLSRTTRQGRGIVRDSYGPGEQAAHDIMHAAADAIGLEVSIDAIGNLMMTLPGRDRSAPRIIIGSHLDSVPQGGNYDGAAGVVAGLCILSALKRAGNRTRYRHHRHGHSRRRIGVVRRRLSRQRRRFRPARSRVSGDPAIRQRPHSGSHADRARLRSASLFGNAAPCSTRRRIRAYLELHIEQGPTLVAERLPAAAVTGIRGCRRFRNARCIGRYGHSGAVNRAHRHDAVAATVALLHHLETVWLRQEQAGARPGDHVGGAVHRPRHARPQQDRRGDSLRDRHAQRLRRHAEYGCGRSAPRRRTHRREVSRHLRLGFDQRLAFRRHGWPIVRRRCAAGWSARSKWRAAPGTTRRYSPKWEFPPG